MKGLGDYVDAFVEIYSKEKLPFDDLGKECVSVLQNPACEESVSNIVEILREYTPLTRKILLQSIPLYSIWWKDGNVTDCDKSNVAPVICYGSIDMLKSYLKDEIERHYNTNISKEKQEEIYKAFGKIASLNTKGFWDTLPGRQILRAEYIPAYDFRSGKLSFILNLI